MTDTVQQAAAAVEGDVQEVQTADATSGAVVAAVVGATEVGGVAAQVLDSAAEGAAEVAGDAPGAIADAEQDADAAEQDAENVEQGAASDADKLFAKVKDEIEGLVNLVGHEWDLLKGAIAKHL